jgi:uncharacterized phage protein (TIGR02218 family)
VQGTNEYRYTTQPFIVSDSTNVWEPVSIDSSEVTQSNEMAKDAIKLIIPRDNVFARLFLGGVPEQITTVTIFRGDGSEEDYQYYWKGRIAGASASGDAVTLECENIFTSMRRSGLRALYQKNCRHSLYGRGCNLNDYDFAVAATAIAVSGFNVTIDVDSTINESEFTGGTLETSDGFLRYIINHTGTTLQLIRPLLSLEEEVNGSNGLAPITLYPGCDHTMTACKDKFNNLNNYGGFAWLPSVNPFSNEITGSII